MKAKSKKRSLNGTAEKAPRKKAQDVKNYILIGVGLTATGIAGYFGYQYYKKHKATGSGITNFVPPPVYTETQYPSNTGNQYSQQNNNTYSPPQQTESNTNQSSGSGTIETLKEFYQNIKASFPLKKGSKGPLVKQLQQALIASKGKSILPKYGADGDFGTETVNALKKLKYSTSVTESLYHVIVGTKGSGNSHGSASLGYTHAELAAQLLSALIKSNYPDTISLLKKLKNKQDYNATSEIFKQSRLHGVRQTLVNGALSTFSDQIQKQAIRLEFLRMGLKYNGVQWSLSGIGTAKIITKETAQIWLDGYRNIEVPANMILGTPLAEKLDFTLFENNGRNFLVRTISVKPL